LLAYYKHVILLGEKVPALYTKNIEFFHKNAETKVIAYYRWSDEGTPALVVANFSIVIYLVTAFLTFRLRELGTS